MICSLYNHFYIPLFYRFDIQRFAIGFRPATRDGQALKGFGLPGLHVNDLARWSRILDLPRKFHVWWSDGSIFNKFSWKFSPMMSLLMLLDVSKRFMQLGISAKLQYNIPRQSCASWSPQVETYTAPDASADTHLSLKCMGSGSKDGTQSCTLMSFSLCSI